MLKCDNLSVTLGQKEIIKSVSFELKKGQNLLILGENGAGKSTLAKAICSLVKHSGDITIFGQKADDMSGKTKAKALNYIPPKLHPYDEEIALAEYAIDGFFVHKNKFEPYTKEEQKETDDALAKLGLLGLREAKLHALSSGEKQLAAIAQAMLQNAAITIFDEPLANIDTKRSVTLFDILTKGTEFGSKIVITHDLHFAYSLGFDILYLQDGKVDFFGKSTDFFAAEQLQKRFGSAVTVSENGVVISYAKI